MASAAAGVADRHVSLGRVIGRGLATVRTNPAATLGIALLFGALPGAALALLFSGLGGLAVPDAAVGNVVFALLLVILSLALGVITQGALVRATIAHSEGRRAGFAESIRAGLHVLLPLILLSLLIGVATAIGFALLVVPGVILYAMWSVAVPALVEERRGVLGALARSRELTRGARWRIFALGLLVYGAYYLFLLALGAAVASSGGGTAEALAAGQRGFGAFYWLTILFQAIASALLATIQTALYVELRNWKEGPAADRLADIFS